MTIPEKKKYRHNFVTNAICRLDFRSVPEINEDLLNRFRDVVKSDFPKVEEKTIRAITARLEQSGVLEQVTLPDQKMFQYIDANSENKIELAPDHLAIESFKYINFREFGKNIELALGAFGELVENPDFTRLGLRYVNQIVLNKGNPLIWANYVDSSFVSVIDRFFERSPNLARTMSQVVLNYDEYKLNFNYGIHNSEFPAKISRKEFILDFDFYTEYVEKEQIMPQLIRFNKESGIMFEKCIKDTLRKHMEVVDE